MNLKLLHCANRCGTELETATFATLRNSCEVEHKTATYFCKNKKTDIWIILHLLFFGAINNKSYIFGQLSIITCCICRILFCNRRARKAKYDQTFYIDNSTWPTCVAFYMHCITFVHQRPCCFAFCMHCIVILHCCFALSCVGAESSWDLSG